MKVSGGVLFLILSIHSNSTLEVGHVEAEYHRGPLARLMRIITIIIIIIILIIITMITIILINIGTTIGF